MSETLIPDKVRTFLLEYIDSVAQLEALLLLRNNPNCAWTAETMSKRLYISVQETAALLQKLAGDGFLIIQRNSPEQYQYDPESDDLAGKVEQLAELYGKYLIPITHIIHAKPRTRIQEFADAFKWRKGE